MADDRKRRSGNADASSAAGPSAELELVKRELREALDRQTATNEILHVISGSPSDTQLVFDAIVRSGSKLFPGAAITVALPIGENVEAVAVADEGPIRAEAWRQRFLFPLTREYMHGVGSWRDKKKTSNDADRLRKYLARFDLTWHSIQD
jgi:hypothetical protein